MNVARNVMLDPRLVPGGGAAEMALAHVSTSMWQGKLFVFNLQIHQCSSNYSQKFSVPKVAVPS